ncbi:unnamed protein product [Closterium sp. NIES-53]
MSHVDPRPLVKSLEVSSDTSGQTEGGDHVADDIAATCRSPSLETPPGFPPPPSSPPLQPVAVDSGVAGGGDPGGADSRRAGFGGATSPTGGRVMGSSHSPFTGVTAVVVPVGGVKPVYTVSSGGF